MMGGRSGVALLKVLIGSVPVIAVLVAAAFVASPDISHIARQIVLCALGVGGMLLAERLLFGPPWRRVVAALGFTAPHARAVMVALIVSVPIWAFLPIYGWASGAPIALNGGWPAILIGVVLVNGIAEEVIHRAFVFGHLRERRSFAAAAAISGAVFAAQHLYLMFTIGTVAGLASVLLALFLVFPLAFLYERGGRSIAAPAILHTSANAPIMLLVTPDAAAAVILPHMAVVIASMYLAFALHRRLPAATDRASDV